MSSGTNTPNLGLHNWIGTDKVLRSEFNDNFTAIDTFAGQAAKLNGTAAFTTNQTAPAWIASGLTGAQGTGRWAGVTTAAGAPTSGTFSTGDFVPDPFTPAIWFCTSGGSPGTWQLFNPPLSARGLSNLLHPQAQSFMRSTPASRLNGQSVAANQLRTEMGRFNAAAFIEEATTNLGINTGFETVTGTAQVFADPMTSYAGSAIPAPWTSQGGSFSFSASGALSGGVGSNMTAGNPSWKPLTGSNGAALAQTVQATITTASTLSGDLLRLRLYVDANNYYQIKIYSTGMELGKNVGGVYTALASVPQTISVSTSYTATLALDSAGNLTGKVYNGVGTGGSLLQTLTPSGGKDTALSGPYLLGVGADSGTIKSVQVTAPFPDGWTIGGDLRVAWALTNNAIRGKYSMSAVGVAGVTGWIQQTVNFPASAPCAFSTFIEGTGVGLAGARLGIGWYNGSTWVASHYDSGVLNGTFATTRKTFPDTSPAGVNNGSILLQILDVGTVIFDAVQLEQKAYETTYVENIATTGTATRNADSLSFNLAQPLPNRWFGALVWKPQLSSAQLASRTNNVVLLTTATVAGTLRHQLVYQISTNKFYVAKFDGTSWYTNYSTPITFNSGDTIMASFEDDPVTSQQLALWVSVNGGTPQKFTLGDTHQFTDAQLVYLGGNSTTGYEANGTIDYPIIHGLATGETITDDQVNALFQASTWGQGPWPGALPDKIQIGTATVQDVIQSNGVNSFNVYNPSGDVLIEAFGNTLMASNALRNSDGTWSQPNKQYNSSLLQLTNYGDAQIYVAPPGSNGNLNFTTSHLLQAISGGYKVQSGQATSDASGNCTVTFPTAFTNGSVPIVVATEYGSTGAGQIMIYSATATNFVAHTYDASGTLTQRVFDWIAIGT